MNPTSQDADALRIQAAAVVAQQAALLHEELRLNERRQTIDQQESQLASLLDEKRRRLAALRDEVQQSREASQRDQATQQKHLAEMTQQLKVECAELADGWEHVGSERRRLLRLRDRLRRRWHRNWAKEREKLRRQEAALHHESQQIQQQKQELAFQQASIEQVRLECNAEAELARRETQAGFDGLNEERRRLQEHQNQIRRRETEVAKTQRRVAGEKRRWLKDISRLQAESLGLKQRIQNQRCKLIDLERRASRLASLGVHPTIANLPNNDSGDDRSAEPSASGVDECTEKLDALAGDLADQRLHLAEQWQRFLEAETAWSVERERAAAQLEELARTLDERESAVERSEDRCRQRVGECERQRRYLQGMQAQWTARLAAWHGERERLLAELRSREDQLERVEKSVPHLLQRWQQRYQDAVLRLKSEYSTCRNERLRLAATDHGSETAPPYGVVGKDEADRLHARFEELTWWASELATKDGELINLLSTCEQGRAAADSEMARLRLQVGDLRATLALTSGSSPK